MNCRRCKQNLPDSNFRVTIKRGKPYMVTICNDCSRKDANKKYGEEAQEVRRSIIIREYGLAPEDLQSLKKSQNYSCAICKTPTDDFHIDHSHETQEVRGLLCRKCNMAIGLFNDNIVTLRNAISYLESGTHQKTLKSHLFEMFYTKQNRS